MRNLIIKESRMKDSQLEKMSISELIDLKSRIDAIMTNKKDRKRVELKERLAAMAKEEGYTIAELYNGAAGRKAGRGGGRATSSAAKYQHPDNPAMTWSGRGRKPNWVKELGGDIERYRVG
jgi:DNA-binding protein H-NS